MLEHYILKQKQEMNEKSESQQMKAIKTAKELPLIQVFRTLFFSDSPNLHNTR